MKILAKVRVRIPHAPEARSTAPSPRYRVRCDCGRVFVVCEYPSQILTQRHCKACSPPRRRVNNRYAAAVAT